MNDLAGIIERGLARRAPQPHVQPFLPPPKPSDSPIHAFLDSPAPLPPKNYKRKAPGTHRRYEIGKLWVLSGDTKSAIAANSGVGVKCIEKHISDLYREIGPDFPHTQLGLAKWLVARGLITLEQLFPPGS